MLDDLMAGVRTPPICRRIRELRKERYDLDKPEAKQERRANHFSQEAVAQRVGVTLKAYRAYEESREPDYERRRAIAVALELPEDYFEGQLTRNDEIRGLREAVSAVDAKVDEILRRLVG